MKTIRRDERITAAEVKKLPPGTKVKVHSYDKYGYPCFRECRVTVRGRSVKLQDESPYFTQLLEIKKETDRRWYAVEVEEMYG